jgi:hypothetical protein
MHSTGTGSNHTCLTFPLKNSEQSESPNNRILDPFNLVHPDGHHSNKRDKPEQLVSESQEI